MALIKIKALDEAAAAAATDDLVIEDTSKTKRINLGNLAKSIKSILGLYTIQTGQVNISFGTTAASTEFKFPQPFSSTPNVFVCLNAGTYWIDRVRINASGKNESSFIINHVGTVAASGTLSVQWVAIGK